ncbi:MAG TPA: alanine racemase, partial [Alphaproteobacteria bacterium]|nr:alanine racemase [Alphaproteobacteria bacterium]
AAEACAIRPFVPHAQIFVLHGFDASAAGSFRDFRLTPVLNTPGQIKAYAGTGITLPAAVHIDTGMARLGLAPDEIAAALSLTNIALVMSHLACGDDPASPMNARQLADFNAARQSLPTAPASIAASGGTFLGSDFLLDLVRPGICLYGGAPHPGLP